MKVIKRNGKIVDFDNKKIDSMISLACKGLNVNKLKLLSQLKLSYHNNMTTKYIHKETIEQAKKLISLSEPDWRIVAGRLVLMEHLKTKKEFHVETEYKALFQLLKEKVYSYNDFKHLFPKKENVILWNMPIESVITLLKDIGNESLESRYFHIALTLGLLSNINNIPKYYEVLSTQKLSLPTVIFTQLGKIHTNLDSCLVTQLDDDLENILDTFKEIGMATKYGGGWGLHLDRIRSRGSKLQGVENRATGIVRPLKVLNDLMLYIDQAKANKKGVLSPSLSIWHYDIIEFLKTNRISTDCDDHCRNLFHQVIVNNYFLNRVKTNKDWYLFDPYETNYVLVDKYGKEFLKEYVKLIRLYKKGKLKLVKKIKAKDIFKEIIKTALQSGTPFLYNIDNMMSQHRHNDNLVIPAYNLCMESSSPFNTELTHSCTLAGVVLPNIKSKEELIETTKIGIEILNIINLEILAKDKTEWRNKIVKHKEKFNVIGLGLIGYHDYCVKNNVRYEDSEELAEDLLKTFVETSIRSSCEYPNKNRHYTYKVPEFLDQSLNDLIKEKGMANYLVNAIAPTSSSNLRLNVSNGVEPIQYLEYTEDNLRGQFKRTVKYPEIAYLYTPYHKIDKFKLNKIMSIFNKYIDTGVSYKMKFNLLDNNEKNISYIVDTLLNAFNQNIKTIYYIFFNEIKEACGDSCNI